jgi:hypothetical protein
MGCNLVKPSSPGSTQKIDCYKMRMTSRLKIESSILEHLRQPNLKINALTRLEIGYFERSKWVAIRRWSHHPQGQFGRSTIMKCAHLDPSWHLETSSVVSAVSLFLARILASDWSRPSKSSLMQARCPFCHLSLLALAPVFDIISSSFKEHLSERKGYFYVKCSPLLRPIGITNPPQPTTALTGGI